MARVVIVTTSYPRELGDPSGHFVAAEARARAARGDAVTVLCPGRSRDAAPGPSGSDLAESPRVVWLPGGDAFGWPGALERLRQRPQRALSVASFLFSARRALAQAAPDEVIAHWLVPSAWPIAGSSRGALEIVLHGTDVRLVERWPRPLRVTLVERLLARGARFRFVSSELRDRLVAATTPSLRHASRVEPSPIEVVAPSRADARARLGISETECVALVATRLVHTKRPTVAVRLARALSPDRIVVIGDGPSLDEVRREDPRASCMGRLSRDETLTWIAAADVLVSASREEGAPTVVREARALGTRVLAVPSGDLRQWAQQDPGITLVDA